MSDPNPNGAETDLATGPRVVLDYPARDLARRAWRRLVTVAGGALVLIGVTASIGAVPACIGALALLAGWVLSDPIDDLPPTETVLACVILTPVAIGGLYYGLRLLRRHRTFVLFLRRFGHDDAQQAVSFAVLRTIGPYWRIVTLDDAEIAPIGIPPATRTLFRTGASISGLVGRVALLTGLKTYPRLLLAMIGMLILAVAGPAADLVRTGRTSPEPWLAALEPYLASVDALVDGRPLDAITLTLPGLFALLVTAAFVSFIVLVASLAVLVLLIFPLQPVVSFVSSLTKAVGEGEAAKTAVAQSEFDVCETARAIAGRSRRVFAPRLVVVTVTASEWQLAVRELAARAFVVLLDVSEPTSNVLWELEELTSTGTPYVAIGELGQVARVASPAAEDFPDDGLACRLRALLGEREILAYTTDPRGLGRFARALRAVLLERERFCEATAAPARGSARSAPSRSAGP